VANLRKIAKFGEFVTHPFQVYGVKKPLAMCACVLNGFVYGVDYGNGNTAKVSDITYFFKTPEAGKETKSADEKRNEEIAALFKGKRVYFSEQYRRGYNHFGN
jgi:hypothetical protein